MTPCILYFFNMFEKNIFEQWIFSLLFSVLETSIWSRRNILVVGHNTWSEVLKFADDTFFFRKNKEDSDKQKLQNGMESTRRRDTEDDDDSVS